MFTYNGLNPATNNWNVGAIDDYREQFSYTPDGSILALKRNGSGSNIIDNATWNYYTGTHRLEHISDPAGRHGFDAGMQSDSNYRYDNIGEMTADIERGLTHISWNVYGKVVQQQLADGRTINYTYDAGANRISKQVTGSGAYTEWYVRDASGNVLSIYKKTDSLRQTEQYKYGSNILGLRHHTVNMEAQTIIGNIRSFTAGEDEYYLNDHRGNNMVTVTDTRTQHDDNGDDIVDYYTVNIVAAQDYSSFGALLDGRQYGTTPRFTYNGKQLDKETGWQDYGMREYLGGEVPIFASVDPLTKKYPWYSPYQFAGNNPIKFIDLDGGEPKEPGAKQGQAEVAAKNGTEDFFNWSWNIDKKSKNGSWVQGSSTMYQNGDVANVSSHDDNTKTYHPDVQVAPLVTNQTLGLSPLPLPKVNNNSFTARYIEFTGAFTAGTKLENDAAQEEAQLLLNNFARGASTILSFRPTSNMARILGKDPAFMKLAQSFEQQALAYYNGKGTLEGFNGRQVLINLGMPYIKDTWYMHTVLGGTQQWNAQITKISANQVKVRYMVWDHFGAGTDDAQSYLPGLPSLYWLQHNSVHYYPSTSGKYAPFNWNIRVNR